MFSLPRPYIRREGDLFKYLYHCPVLDGVDWAVGVKGDGSEGGPVVQDCIRQCSIHGSGADCIAFCGVCSVAGDSQNFSVYCKECFMSFIWKEFQRKNLLKKC